MLHVPGGYQPFAGHHCMLYEVVSLVYTHNILSGLNSKVYFTTDIYIYIYIYNETIK